MAGGEKLKLDNEQMQEHATKVSSAITTYKNFAEEPFKDQIKYLEDMNADFTVKLKTMLEDIDDDNSTVLEALEEIETLTKGIVDTLEKLDADGVESMSGSEGGK